MRESFFFHSITVTEIRLCVLVNRIHANDCVTLERAPYILLLYFLSWLTAVCVLKLVQVTHKDAPVPLLQCRCVRQK